MEFDPSTGLQDSFDERTSLLMSSSTNARTEALKRILNDIQDEGREETSSSKNEAEQKTSSDGPSSRIVQAYLPYILSTYPRYADRPSRRAVEACLRAYLTRGDTALRCGLKIAEFLSAQSSTQIMASSNAFVLLEWACVVQTEISRKPDVLKRLFLTVSLAQALLLDAVSKPEVRESIHHSALVLCRRGLRAILKSGRFGSEAFGQLLAALTASTATSTRYAAYLGVLAGVSARIPDRKPQLEAARVDIIEFYCKQVLGSKTPVSPYEASGLHDFFSAFVTAEDVSIKLVPVIERGLLRSPEVILHGIIESLAESLSPTIDTTDCMTTKLVKPLINSISSTNPQVREGASRALSVLLQRGGDTASLRKVTGELLASLKTAKTANSELKGTIADSLKVIPQESSISSEITQALAPVAMKETNETALRRQVSALSTHITALLNEGVLEKTGTEALLKGATEKRPPFRKAWLQGIGQVLKDLNSPPQDPKIQAFLSSALDVVSTAYNEVAASPLPSAQSGFAAAAYVLPALLSSSAFPTAALPKQLQNIKPHILSIQPKISFLIDHRVYSRAVSSDDSLWALHALISTSSELENVDSTAKAAWAKAILQLLLAPGNASAVRRETGSELSRAYTQNPLSVGEAIIAGLWDTLRSRKLQPDLAEKSGTPDTDLHLSRALKIITPSKRKISATDNVFTTNVIEAQSVKTIVLSQPELIPDTDWIADCLGMGVDPGELCSHRSKEVFEEVLSHFEPEKLGPLSQIERASCDAMATMAFVAPQTSVSMLLHQIENDFAPSQFEDIGPTEAAIAHAPEGVVFVDVLNSKTNGVVENKNRKDYDVEKWEQELRYQLAQKKGVPQKKLTADQQAKVEAQLAKEVIIRQKVRKASSNARRGAGIIQSLASGPPTDASLWMSGAITALTTALQAGAGLITGQDLVAAYLACSNQVSDRLGTIRPTIGVATLRALGNVPLPDTVEAESLSELGTRVLYRLRFAAEQRPFDVTSFAYVLPLVFSVLENGKIGNVDGEDADAQVLLALEFLSFQVEPCSDSSLPRKKILDCIIQSMQRFPQHHRLLRDTLIGICSSLSSTINHEERQVLLGATTLPQTAVRSAVLQAIDTELDLSDMGYSVHVWIACQDEDDENAEMALNIWQENEFGLQGSLLQELPRFLGETAMPTRIAAAKALSQALAAAPQAVKEVLDGLEAEYKTKAQPLVPKPDKFGIIQKRDLIDPWEHRSGIALAFKEAAPVIPVDDLLPLMDFLVSEGPLSDRNGNVRAEMMEAGATIVNVRGSERLEPLMELFESVLSGPDKGTEEADWVNEAVIVLYGSLASHLPSGDPRISTVLTKLTATLSTPSESVQFAVASCLPPLTRDSSVDVGTTVSELLDQLFQSKQYASRRGAAYGLAGLVKGKGISVLRQCRIMSSLRTASENKKSSQQRQGAMFAYELFSLILGRTFEPYVVDVLPQLLACFGDPDASVREACLDTAKTCFASLSSFGVHQVLPRLLEGLDETQWRSKKGACDLLGAMAYLDPEQLAISLPDIIPPLTAALTDTHKEVRAAANNSLQRFGEVITNPEVKSLVSVLLRALSDPNKYTEDALDGLIKVSFIHYLDAPSLALVVRILERGLGDRSSTKRKAAQIIGSLAHLTERRDIVTHLPILVSGLRTGAVDPVPATRATASKALGSLVEKLGEDALPDLIPSLMTSLRTDTGAGDRLGSAQALSEVLAGLGTVRLEETLPTILQNVASTRATVREGFMTLFIFLPACFGNNFANYLAQIIPSILSGLADEIEAIRDTALRAGRLLVKNFATKAIDLLLPELQRGLADDNYRIRLSSVELVGDLLFNLTGITNKAETDEDEDNATAAGQSLLEVLGEERRNKVLSSLYICRCDTSGMVRTAAINVWKALVATPRTLRELVPTLTQMIITRLASPNMEHKVIAGNALGELIRKAGEGVFAALLPSLEDGLETSTDADNRQGICIALREVINAASPDSLEEHEKKLISIVRIALVDSDETVRDAAAESFDALQQVFGKRAVDQVLPHLLNLLRNEDEAENALAALLTLLTEATRANVILPNLVPTLLINPISAFNARALASLAKVGGASMTRRLPIILNNLADNVITCKDEELRGELNVAFDTVLQSVDEYDGLNTAMSVMLAMMKHEDHHKRAIAASHLAAFFAAATVDYSRYNQDLVRILLISFDDRDKVVVSSAWSALSQLQSHMRKEEMESLVPSTRQVLHQVGTVGNNLPGFLLPKGILPVLQIFLQGLMNGTADQRVQAAMGISDIIDKSNADSLKPFVTQITGPLIRVVGERSVEVKTAIMLTLNQLLQKIPTFLRPFLPQLQRTFTKSIADPSSDLLRTRATKALSTLITLTPRVDPLIAELVAGAKAPDDDVRNAMLKALQEVVSKVGANMSDASRDSILTLMDSQSDIKDDNMTMTNARLLGAMIKVLSAEKATSLIKSRVLSQPATYPSILALNAVLLENASVLIDSYLEEIKSVLKDSLIGSSTFVQQNAVLATGKLLLSNSVLQSSSCEDLLTSLSTTMKQGNDIDTRRLTLVVIRTISRHYPELIRPHLSVLVPSVFASVRDPVIPVKLAAEAAFLQLFEVVEAESEVFDGFMSGPGKELPMGVQRPMAEYFKRVALKLGVQARERRDAEGGQGGLGLSRDEEDDEKEVWSVGRVEVEGVIDGD